MKQRQQSSTSYPITFLMVDSADHITGKTGLSPTVTISKNGAGFGAPSGAVSEIGNGWYALAGNATDRNALGDLLIHATAAGADPVDDRYCIVPWNPFDAAAMGLSNLDAAISSRLAAASYSAPPSASDNATAAAAAILAAADSDPISANVTYWSGDAVAGAPALETTAQAILEDTGTTLPTLVAGIAQTVNSTTDCTTTSYISRRRGDSWSIPLTIGSVTGYTSLWFTLKLSKDDLDSAALVQIKLNASETGDGLLVVNGATASDDTKGSITVLDATTGAINIALDETITDDLAPGDGYYYDVQALISGAVTTPDSGTFDITADVTRSVA